MMEILAITLDKKGKRYKTFIENNSHLKINPFDARIGQNLTKEQILEENLATLDFISHDTFFSYGAIGCAASHKTIWEKSRSTKKEFLVFEDDCYTHPQIGEFIKENTKTLNKCDICFFGLTTNSVVEIQSPQGIKFSKIYFDPPYPKPEWINNAFSNTSIKNVTFNKFLTGFGYWAYYVTPKGAEKLINLIFPLSLKTTKIPLIRSGKAANMPCISIDRSGCAIYRDIDALMTYPFLAYNQNNSPSTTHYLDE